MSKGDALIESGAEKLRDISSKAAARGGIAAKLAEPLADDADFLRKLKPSLIKARARGRDVDEPTPLPPPSTAESDGRRNPLPLLGAAVAAGVAAAKMLAWRGHAHPRG